MKLLAACLLAVVLVFRVAPLCAAPAIAEAVTAMPDCDDTAGHHDEERGQKGKDAARACHACVFPPVAGAVFNHSMPPTAAPNIKAATRFAGRIAEPPTPPPRFGSANHLSIFQRS